MRLRTYRAWSNQQALDAARRDLGPNVSVLQTRTVRAAGLRGLFSARIIELTVRLPEPPAAIAQPLPADTSAREKPLDMKLERAKTQRLAQAIAAKLEREGHCRNDNDRNERAVETVSALRQSTAQSASPEPTVGTPPSAVARRFVLRNGEGADRRQAERAELLGDPINESAPTIAPDPLRVAARSAVASEQTAANTQGLAEETPENLKRVYRALIEQAVSHELAESMLTAIAKDLTPEQLQDAATVGRAAHARIAAMLPVDESPLSQRTLGRPHVVALIGPTGVGKTTTIAKLAATCRFNQGQKVGLITTDTFRMAAVDQLRRYAEILQLPLEVALDPEHMPAALERLASCDVILIDTAGRSRRDTDRLGELRKFLHAARPDEIHLVLSTTSGERTMRRDAEAFASLGANRVVLTKLDESDGFGVVLEVIRRLGTRISFVTTGQEVPDDIEPGSGGAQAIARLLLDGLSDAENTTSIQETSATIEMRQGTLQQ